MFAGFRSWPHEAQHVNDRLQEELENGGNKSSAELCGNTAVRTQNEHANMPKSMSAVRNFKQICMVTIVGLSDSDAFDFEYRTVVLRMNQGLDMSHLVEEEGQHEVTV